MRMPDSSVSRRHAGMPGGDRYHQTGTSRRRSRSALASSTSRALYGMLPLMLILTAFGPMDIHTLVGPIRGRTTSPPMEVLLHQPVPSLVVEVPARAEGEGTATAATSTGAEVVTEPAVLPTPVPPTPSDTDTQKVRVRELANRTAAPRVPPMQPTPEEQPPRPAPVAPGAAVHAVSTEGVAQQAIDNFQVSTEALQAAITQASEVIQSDLNTRIAQGHRLQDQVVAEVLMLSNHTKESRGQLQELARRKYSAVEQYDYMAAAVILSDMDNVTECMSDMENEAISLLSDRDILSGVHQQLNRARASEHGSLAGSLALAAAKVEAVIAALQQELAHLQQLADVHSRHKQEVNLEVASHIREDEQLKAVVELDKEAVKQVQGTARQLRAARQLSQKMYDHELELQLNQSHMEAVAAASKHQIEALRVHLHMMVQLEMYDKAALLHETLQHLEKVSEFSSRSASAYRDLAAQHSRLLGRHLHNFMAHKRVLAKASGVLEEARQLRDTLLLSGTVHQGPLAQQMLALKHRLQDIAQHNTEEVSLKTA